ncbi:hypothetical protein GYA25_00600 [Candidatus Woesearchaeota archaeon]|jgi:hypothetical protein|nr:hypothetical protein [Candidatus Woesearchaeota archaeon]
MNFQFLVEKLESSGEFQDFIKNNKDAYLCSGFFIFDYESNFENNKYSLDFYVPSNNKIISFELEKEVKIIPLDNYDEEIPKKIDINLDFDFENIKDNLLNEIEIRGIKNKVQKMLFSLQTKDNENFILGTIFVSNLGLIKISLKLKKDKIEIIEFEKKSFFDMLKFDKKSKN